MTCGPAPFPSIPARESVPETCQPVRAVSSAGQNVWFTPKRSQVRVLYRPPSRPCPRKKRHVALLPHLVDRDYDNDNRSAVASLTTIPFPIKPLLLIRVHPRSSAVPFSGHFNRGWTRMHADDGGAGSRRSAPGTPPATERRPEPRSRLTAGRHRVVRDRTASSCRSRLRLRLRQPFRCRFTDNDPVPHQPPSPYPRPSAFICGSLFRTLQPRMDTDARR